MAFKKVMKRGKRMVRKATKFVKKVNRHPITKGIASVAKIAQMVKLLNVEKKRVDITFSNINFSQFNGVGIAGYSALAITPTIIQGITGSTRNGNSVKLVSACFDFQFTQQANALNNSNIKWYIVCMPDYGSAPVANSIAGRLLEVNPFSSVIDYHSSRDPEYFSSLKIIKSGTVKMLADQLTTQTYYAQRKIPLKLSHHLKYNSDASSITTKNAFFMIFTQDQGDTNIATGATVSLNARYYYVDN